MKKIEIHLINLKRRCKSFKLSEEQTEMILNDATKLYFQGQTDNAHNKQKLHYVDFNEMQKLCLN